MCEKDNLPILYGGLGEKVSNGGTQYYFQDRVYDTEHCAISITVSFNPWYLVKETGKDKELRNHE